MEEKPAPRSVGELMERYGGIRSDVSKKVLGVRMPINDLASLEALSQRIGVNKGALARDLLSAALKEAFSRLRFDDAEDEAEFYQFAAQVQEEHWESAIDEHVEGR